MFWLLSGCRTGLAENDVLWLRVGILRRDIVFSRNVSNITYRYRFGHVVRTLCHLLTGRMDFDRLLNS
jgi:hypothetical protein